MYFRRFIPYVIAVTAGCRSSQRAKSILSNGIEPLEPRQLLSISPVPAAVGVQPMGALAGRIVYTKGGHGYTYMAVGTGPTMWQTQRPFINNMVEDMGNEDQDTYFAHYLLQAGATVVPTRPVDHQVNESVIDNSNAYTASTGGFSVISGTWGSSVQQPYWSNNNGNDTAHYRFATIASTETAVARFTANIPVAGYYPVYAWAKSDTDRVTDQTFRINYPGGSYEVRVNLLETGDGWIYLGNYYFNAGVSQTSGSVDVSNKSSMAGTNPSDVVIADAIRFGNGMGDYVPAGAPGPSGEPREEEAALYWDYDSRGWTASGTRVSSANLDQGLSSDYKKDFAAADIWAAYMNQSNEGSMYDRLWISFHSNASGSSGTGQGTLGLITGTPTPNQANLAKLAGTTVTNELTTLTTQGPNGTTTPGYDGTWGSAEPPDHTFTNAYGEISNGYINSEFDATIIEVAFHDNSIDSKLLEDPKVRDAVARATLHTAIDYFHNPVGNGSVAPLANTTFLPEPPTDVRATTDASGNVTIAWTPGLVSNGTTGPYGNTATSYKVYTSTNGIGFDGGVIVSAGTSLTFSGMPLNAPTYFRVTALNAGGESFGSAVAVAKAQATRHAPILIVDNFSRLDRAGDQLETNTNLETVVGDGVTTGTLDRVNSLYNNAQNYVTQAAAAIQAFNPNLGIETCTDTSIANGEVSLANYQAVIWMSGEQSMVDRTFNATVQPLVTSYLNGGGKMFVSGAEIGFDLVPSGHGSSFFTNTLKAGYVADDANTYSTTGASGSIFNGIALTFDNGTSGTYDVNTPDEIAATGGSISAMTYVGGLAGTAGIQYTSGNTQLVYLAFPFETITTLANRNAVMSAVLTYFNTNSTNLSTPPTAPDLSASKDSGSSSTDNLTNINNSSSGKTLSFSVPGVISGASVTIYSDGTAIGSGTASGSSVTITTNGTFTLTDGNHTITAIQTATFQLASSASTGLPITIDTVAPTITPATFNYNTGQSLTYTFGETLAAAPTTGSVSIKPAGSSTAVTTAANYNAATRTIIYTFPSGILPSANYNVTLSGSAIVDPAGNADTGNQSDSFFFLTGDADHNRTVNSDDFSLLAANFGQSAKHFVGGDFNYDGVTNALDFNALATNYGANLPAPGDQPDAEAAATPLAISRPLVASQPAVLSAQPAQTLFSDHPVRVDSNLTDLIA